MIDEQTDQSVTINGKEYEIASLSDDAKQQIVNIRFVDQEIERLKNQAAVAQAARKSYTDALDRALPDKN